MAESSPVSREREAESVSVSVSAGVSANNLHLLNTMTASSLLGSLQCAQCGSYTTSVFGETDLDALLALFADEFA